MSDKYKLSEKEKAYFLTMTVVGWIDIFTHKNHKMKIVDSLKYCQKNKGLSIFGWCLMSSHLHMIARADGDQNLSEIIRDFKKFTSKSIVDQIINEPDSRSEWLLDYFSYSANRLKRNKNYKFWQDGNQAKIIYSNSFFYEKLTYIHMNPVKKMIVEKPEQYLFSSARNYAELDSLLDIVLETQKLRSY